MRILLFFCRIAVVSISAALAGCSAIYSPVTETDVAQFTTRLTEELAENAPPHQPQLTVYRAVAMAIRYNHTLRTKELEADLAEAKTIAQAGSMLPQLVAQSQYYRRDRPQLSRSSGSALYSGSSEQRSITQDLSLSWNVLDFGLSLVRARQGADKAQQQHEESLRIRARIAEEARSTYWRAVALTRLDMGMARLDRVADEALALTRIAARDKSIDPLVPINLQRDIMTAQRDLVALRTSLAGAMDQLRASVGLAHDAPVTLVSPVEAAHVGPTQSATDDIGTALRQRPEIRQLMYDLRITDDEVGATILQILPGVTFSRTRSSDSNAYLLHEHWVGSGLKVVENLMAIVRLPAELAAIEAQAAVQRQSALATAAMIAMQVHVSRARVAVHHRAYQHARRFATIQSELLRQVRAAVTAEKTSRQTLLREQLSTLLAEIRAVVAFGDLEAAQAAYATARGDEALGGSDVAVH